MKIAIIGGGASGLFLANYLENNAKNVEVTIYERNKSLGRKLLASGNGKCNFMNYKAMPFDYNNEAFISKLFQREPIENVLNYFQRLGLLFKFDEEGRMYPKSESSETVLSILADDLTRTKIRLEQTVSSLEYRNKKVIINNTDSYDIAIIATGSNAGIDDKKASSTYSYLEGLKLRMTPLIPSLVGFRVHNAIKPLSGLRSKALVILYKNNVELSREFGEVIFKDDGISGICIMNLSRLFDSDGKYQIKLDLKYDLNELKYTLKRRASINQDPHYFLAGSLHPRLIDYLIKNKITQIDAIIALLADFRLDIRSTYEAKFAQAMRGGIDLSQINDDFSLKKYSSIYATGEALDIDGKCGGYNLLFAFLSALAVGKRLVEKYEISNN